MKKPPKRLVIKPGRYLMRNDLIAVVTKVTRADDPFPCKGHLDSTRNEQSWRLDGRWGHGAGTGPGDLIKRLPDAEPKPAKRERLEWCVVIPYRNELSASLFAQLLNRKILIDHVDPEAVVRRLPMLPATRKET